ncbi:MAG: PspC domain-containing protein [Anaerolineaceae bacterium]|nr:PspC domain-containing protein [Chloroflexota bacterium]UCC54432.1 MAG: PspC domain-containing protein [Anaerolineaceae bacterium]
MSDKRLVRRQSDKMFMGVASGVADYIGIDPVIVRLIFVLLTLWHGWGLLIYFVLAIVMPVEDEVSVSAKANAFDDEEIIIKDA